MAPRAGPVPSMVTSLPNVGEGQMVDVDQRLMRRDAEKSAKQRFDEVMRAAHSTGDLSTDLIRDRYDRQRTPHRTTRMPGGHVTGRSGTVDAQDLRAAPNQLYDEWCEVGRTFGSWQLRVDGRFDRLESDVAELKVDVAVLKGDVA